jgi:hypothetical protein
MDPQGAYIEYLKNDIVRPLEREQKKPEKPIIHKERWALDTKKICPSLEKLPKIQQYKEYYFPSRSKEDVENFRSNFHKTDNISIRIPKIKQIDEKESYLNLKTKFGPHSETVKEGWVPQGNFKTMNNRSSVNYNILSNDDKTNSGAVVLKILDKKITNKKKGVAEIVDLGRPFHSNFNKKYHELVNDNKNIFHVYNGIFSHMYDAAHRNGNIVVPFRNNTQTGEEHHNNNNNYSKRSNANSPRNKISKSPKRSE